MYGYFLFFRNKLAIRTTNNDTIKPIPKIPQIKANIPQRGAVTHHHDQSIVPQSLRTKKIRNRIIKIPIPELLLLLLSICFLKKVVQDGRS
jgi:hypothetical protein